jgi:predicted PurR-regulated permease PerM
VGLAITVGTVTASVLVALIVAATFAPYVDALRQRGWASTKAAAAVSVGALAIVGGVAVLVALAVVPYISELISTIEASVASLRTALAAASVPPEIVTAVEAVLSGTHDWISSAIASAVASAAGVVTVLFLGGFLTFFLLQDGDKAWAWTVSGTSGWRQKALTDSGRDALELVGGYLRGTAVNAATDAASDFVFLTILGVPLAGPLAVLVLLGGFIPYVGTALTTAVLVLVTWSTVGLGSVAILLVLIAITNVIQRRYVAPRAYPRTIDVHPALVLIALPIGAAVAGLLGVIAALPVVAFVMTTSRAVVASLDIEPDAPDSSGLVPVWLDRLAQWSWRSLVVTIVLLVAIAAAVTVPMVVLPIVLAVVLAATLDPAAALLRERGLSRNVASLVVTVGAFLIAAAVLVLTIGSMVGPLQEIVSTSAGGADQTEARRVGLVGFVNAIGSGMLQTVAGLLAGIVGFVVALLLGAILTFFFLRDGPALWDRAIGGMAPVQRGRAQEAGRGAAGVLGGYMVGTGAISVFGAVTQFVIMAVLGIPLALPLAVLSFFGGFIPYIGSFITTGLAFLVTVATGSTTDIIVMGLFTIVFNIVQGNIVAPLVYGKAVNLHPAIILIAIPAGGALAGIIGMFLVVPFVGVVATTWRIVLRMFEEDNGSSTGLAGGPAPPTGAPAAPRGPIPEPSG